MSMNSRLQIFFRSFDGTAAQPGISDCLSPPGGAADGIDTCSCAPTVGFGCPAWARRADMVLATPLGGGPSNKGTNGMDAALGRLDDSPAKDRGGRTM